VLEIFVSISKYYCLIILHWTERFGCNK